jgi:hypothetical protein
MSATSSATASVKISKPVDPIIKPSKINNRVVTKVDVFKEQSCQTGLKVLAVALIVVGVAIILSAAAAGFSLLFAGKVLALDAVVVTLTAALGAKWTIVAISIASIIGLSKLVGGILILKNQLSSDPHEKLLRSPHPRIEFY